MFVSNKHVQQIDELAKLIAEYKLTEASLEIDDFKISLKKSTPKMIAAPMGEMMMPIASEVSEVVEDEAAPVAAPVQQGTPISSPMMGIYYASSSPSSPNYVNEGETVTAGQVVGLIEAMKVFNEIHATVSGTVRKVVAENGQVVNPGDPLMYIG
jgi:acetyl-CoA carboxylase biotin carboxyl carrier protein